MFKHIRTTLMVFMIPVITLTLLIAYFVSIENGIDIINQQTEEKIASDQEAQIAVIDTALQSAEDMTAALASLVVQTYKYSTLETYESILSSLLETQPDLLGVGIWFEPKVYDASKTYVGPYVFKDLGTITTTYDYSNAGYDYLNQPYYLQAKSAMDVIFTDAYYDETSELYMITCSRPMLNSQGDFIGCVTADMELTTMQRMVASYNAERAGNIYIVNREGKYIVTENGVLVRAGKSMLDSMNTTLLDAAQSVLSDDSGTASFVDEKGVERLYFKVIDPLGWRIVYEISDAEITAPVKRLTTVFVGIATLASMLIAFTIIRVTMRSIDKPIQLVMEEFRKIGDNTYDFNIPAALESRKDEFGILGKNLGSMKRQIYQYQRELEEALDENTAAGEELMQQNELLMYNEEQLRQSILYTEAIIKAIPDAMFVISREGVFLDCQGNTSHLYVDMTVFIGKHISEIMPKSVAEKGMVNIAIAFETGRLQTMEYALDVNGEPSYYELRITACFEDRVIAILRNITESHVHVKAIEYLSFHDQVTGLHNRRYFDQQLELLNRPENHPLCIIISDVNGLKLINDSFGHDHGDILLEKYAKILDEARRSDDVIARIGGDEFAIILPNITEPEAENYVQGLLEACQREHVNGMMLSVSFGWACILDEDASVKDVIKVSEDRMYQNKIFEAPSRRNKTIDVIISTLQEKNPREEQHSYRVAEICEAIAQAIGMPQAGIHRIRSAGLLHDIGKIGIPEELLNKPGTLTREEYQDICKHPEIGFRILQAASYMAEIPNIVLSHHERWDGKGYPRGLKGLDIPFESRIIAIADTFDAMTSERSYRQPLPEIEAAKEILKHAGTQFDPELAHIFVFDVLNYAHLELETGDNQSL